MDFDDDAASTITSSSSRPITAPVMTNNNRTHVGFGNSSSSRAATAPTTSGIGNNYGGGGGGEQNVRVVARVRPLSTKELASERNAAESIIAIDDKSTIIIPGMAEGFAATAAGGGAGGGGDERKFVFDAVLGPNSTQLDVYERACGDMISTSIFRGYNATILAYGQTGSGKTFTMGTDGGGRSACGGAGNVGEPSPTEGVISRAVYDLFRTRDEIPNGAERVSVTMSYLEI
jgi:hypothetical protein